MKISKEDIEKFVKSFPGVIDAKVMKIHDDMKVDISVQVERSIPFIMQDITVTRKIDE